MELIITTQAIYLGIAIAAAALLPAQGGWALYHTTCAAGFSAVLFAYKVWVVIWNKVHTQSNQVVLQHSSSGWSVFLGMPLPSKVRLLP